jgi:hypothetical protein
MSRKKQQTRSIPEGFQLVLTLELGGRAAYRNPKYRGVAHIDRYMEKRI